MDPVNGNSRPSSIARGIVPGSPRNEFLSTADFNSGAERCPLISFLIFIIIIVLLCIHGHAEQHMLPLFLLYVFTAQIFGAISFNNIRCLFTWIQVLSYGLRRDGLAIQSEPDMGG